MLMIKIYLDHEAGPRYEPRGVNSVTVYGYAELTRDSRGAVTVAVCRSLRMGSGNAVYLISVTSSYLI